MLTVSCFLTLLLVPSVDALVEDLDQVFTSWELSLLSEHSAQDTGDKEEGQEAGHSQHLQVNIIIY